MSEVPTESAVGCLVRRHLLRPTVDSAINVDGYSDDVTISARKISTRTLTSTVFGPVVV